ncbi:hypothetical protein AB0J38_20555 [Streptomyces sp. NPDC050095]|uniref:hypothetical protein n=1 Tax=unclassified Streptomyces TaxID=2593676 RepID=UPI00341226B4
MGDITHESPSRARVGEAVAEWLCCATDDRRAALLVMSRGELTVLRLGTLFSAVRVPAEIVFAAFETEELAAIATSLRTCLHRAGVIHDPRHRRFYVLVPKHTATLWHQAGAECLGRGSYLGVPSPLGNRPSRDPWATYWLVPLPSPGELCDPARLVDLVAEGRLRQAEPTNHESLARPEQLNYPSVQGDCNDAPT